jgi:hypothetical protein
MDDESRLQALLEPGAHWKHRIVITATKLDLFDRLAHGAKDASEVAKGFGGSPRAYEIFLNALAGLGLLEKSGGRFSNTPFAQRFLVRSSGDYRGDQLVVDDACWELWGKLEESLLTGTSSLESSVFHSLPDIAERLLLGLHRDALEIAPGLAESLPLDGVGRLLDLGGGAGTYSMAFCRRHPGLRSTIFDLPIPSAVARRAVREAGMEERIEVIEGDFLVDPLPGVYDAVFMSNVLHGNGPRQNRELFGKVAGCVEAGGVVIVRDVIMEEDLARPEFGAVFAVNMMLHTAEGRCYSAGEISAWLDDAGFRQVEVVAPGSVLTARKA